MGNKKVIERYDCTYLRQAAMEVTKIVTGKGPHARMPIYGERALDLSFDFAGISGGIDGEMNKGHDINLAEFFNEDAPLRISTLSSERMIVERLKRLFGESEQFTEEIAFAMKKQMLADLTENRKEEYMSPFGNEIFIIFKHEGSLLFCLAFHEIFVCNPFSHRFSFFLCMYFQKNFHFYCQFLSPLNLMFCIWLTKLHYQFYSNNICIF